MGSEQVFDTSKQMDALRKQIQSLVYYDLNHCFGHMKCYANVDNDCKD